MINAGTVQVKLFADTRQYMTAMTAAKNQMKTMGVSAQAFAATSILAFAAFTGAASKMATDFDRRLREISTLIIGVTENDIKNMSREIRDLASVTGKSFDDIGKAKYDIISAGFTDMAESATLLNTATRLAVGGVTSVTNSADLLTSSLNSFQLSGFKAEEAADILFTTVRLGKTTMDELVGSVGRVFPTAKTLGASLADVGAAMATITAGGIKTYEAATYLNQAFTKLGAPSNTAAKAMAEYGIRVFKTEKGMLDLSRTIAQFQGYDLETMRKFFPEIRAIKAVLAMANNMEFLNRALDQTTNSTGATQKAFDKMSKSWSVQLSKKVMQFKDQMVELGDKIMPTIVEEFGNLIDEVSLNSDKIAKSFKSIVTSLSDIASFVTKHGNAIMNIVKAVAAIGIGSGISKTYNKLSKLGILFGKLGTKIAMFSGSITTMSTATGGIVASLGGISAVPVLGEILISLTAIYGMIGQIDSGISNIKHKKMLKSQKEDYEAYLKNMKLFIKSSNKLNKKLNIEIVPFADFKKGFGEEDRKAMSKAIIDGTDKFIVELQDEIDKDFYDKYVIKIPITTEYWCKNRGYHNFDTLMSEDLDTDFYENWIKDRGKEVEKKIDKQNKNMEFEFAGGGLVKNMDLSGVRKQLENFMEYFNVYKDILDIKVDKNLFDKLNVPIDALIDFVETTKAVGSDFDDIAEWNYSKFFQAKPEDWIAITNILKDMFAHAGKEFNYDNFIGMFSEIDSVDPTALENLVSAMSKASKIDMQGDFGFLEFITDMDVTSLEDAVRLVGVWGVSLEDATKAGIYTKEEMEAWHDSFNKLADNDISLDDLMIHFNFKVDPTALENLVSAMGKASKIDMQSDFGFLEFITDMDVTSLEDAVRLVGVWGVSLEQAAESGIYTKEEMEAWLAVFNKLSKEKISLDDLMIHFDLKEAKDEIESFGKTIIDEFSYIAQSISSTMADAFTEIALSGRVAMQELESYNKGLTSNFRTSAEIQEEAWANMWNNILTDTIRTVADMLIQVALLTGGIILANLLTDGVFGDIVKGTTKISETTSKLGKFFYNIFAGDDASGLSKALTKAVIGDGIVTPQGQVIQTDPRDFIIATTDPNSLVNGSGGGGTIYNIYAMDGNDVERVLVKHSKAVARGVGRSVEKRDLRLKSSGNQVRAEY